MTIPTVTILPNVPSRTAAPDTFSDDADAFLGALPTFRNELNAFGSAVDSASSTATAAASTATTKASEAASSASDAEAAAIAALNAPSSNATSTSSITIGTGSKTLTIQTGKAYVVGQFANITRTSSPLTANMYGQITSYDTGTGSLTVNVTSINGSGTYSDWTISPSAPLVTNLPFSSITGTPTTIAGYGITDTPWRFIQAYSDVSNAGALLDVWTEYAVDASSSYSRALPSSPNIGDTIILNDILGLWGNGNFTLTRNNSSHYINNVADSILFNNANVHRVVLVYANTDKWVMGIS